MNINEHIIASYIEQYFRMYLKSGCLISIGVENDAYVINGEAKINIYPFWEKANEVLLNEYNEYTFKGDSIGTIFFFLSGYWEYRNSDIKDAYGRFPASKSFGVLKEILEEPVVDILVDNIFSKAGLEYNEDFIRNRLFLTHDIDSLLMFSGFNFYRSVAADIIKRFDILSAMNKLRMYLTGDDPYSIKRLVHLHKKYGTKGTFFFLPKVQRASDNVGHGYDPLKNSKLIRKYASSIEESGGIIGIHYDSQHLSKHDMCDDVSYLEMVLGKQIKSGRAHYLLFEIRKSYSVYERSNLKLDTTGSYADRVGFRFGTSRPFKPFNFDQGASYDLLEVPLIVMDGSLQNPRYMGLDPQTALKKNKELIMKIKKHGGVFTFLWHNTSFFSPTWSKWESVYTETLAYAMRLQFQPMNAEELLQLYYVPN